MLFVLTYKVLTFLVGRSDNQNENCIYSIYIFFKKVNTLACLPSW